MAGGFVAANTAWIKNTATNLTDVPFTVGCWIWLEAVATAVRGIFFIRDTGTTNNFLGLGMNTAEQITVYAAGGGTTISSSITTAITAGSWHYVIGRFLAADNRRASCLYPNGAIFHTSVATSRSPTGIDQAEIGHHSAAGSVWDGRIAELWYAYGDAQPGTGATDLSPGIVRQLAREGPFSLPFLRDRIYEYFPFRTAVPTGDRYAEQDYYWAKYPKPSWQIGTTNPVLLTYHPPLPYYHRAPFEPKSLLTV